MLTEPKAVSPEGGGTGPHTGSLEKTAGQGLLRGVDFHTQQAPGASETLKLVLWTEGWSDDPLACPAAPAHAG